MKELKPWHKVFVAEYARNGNRGADAARKACPERKLAHTHSWTTLAYSTLRLPHIQEALAKEVESLKLDTVGSRKTLLLESEEVRKKALDSDEVSALGTALRAIELKGRISGAFEREEGDNEKFAKFMALIANRPVNIQNNISVNTQDESKLLLEPHD